jgi:hypothetical protein
LERLDGESRPTRFGDSVKMRPVASWQVPASGGASVLTSREGVPSFKAGSRFKLESENFELRNGSTSRPTGKPEDAKRLRAQEGETGRSAAKMRRGVLVLLLVLGPMEILRGRGNASFGVEYEYRPSG